MPDFKCSEKEFKICNHCLMLSTRPRLTFNEDGVCSACQWAYEKKNVVDWDKRKQELKDYCDKYRRHDGFDVIVPVSGGKDSSTVAHKIKTQYGMTPLCINICHYVDMNTEVNEMNLNNFAKQGFDLIRIYPNQKIERKLDKIGLVEYGQPLFGWLTSMVLTPLKVATKFNIPFIMYGEEGEVEYGGSTKLKNTPIYSVEDTVKFYLSGIHPKTYLSEFSEKELYWWLPPTQEEINKLQPAVAHWSYFEFWNSNHNYEYAKNNVGLVEFQKNSVGTYNKGSQTDSILYPLHVYFMYLKFGFGRCSQDVCIDIRADKISREEGIKLIEQYDEAYPKEFEDYYLDYYEMTKEEFHNLIDKYANKDLLEKRDGMWRKKFKLS